MPERVPERAAPERAQERVLEHAPVACPRCVPWSVPGSVPRRLPRCASQNVGPKCGAFPIECHSKTHTPSIVQMVRELKFQRTVISGTLHFRRHAPGVSFRQSLGRFIKLCQEGGGRPNAARPILGHVFGSRVRHGRKLTPGTCLRDAHTS